MTDNQETSKECATDAPDVFTATDAYAKRFSGEVGMFFLDVQRKTILQNLPDLNGKKILEIGGAHGQMTRAFLEQGAEVWVHASKEESLSRLQKTKMQFPDRLHFITSPLLSLPCDDKSFDFVVAIRLISHVDNWQQLIAEMCRLAKKGVLIDYPPKSSFNILYPLLFALKRQLEGSSTRTFLRFSAAELNACLKEHKFKIVSQKKQFFLPMAFHRTLRCAKVSKFLENICNATGLTSLLGAPVILYAEEVIEIIL